jgi:hypothetical protein
VIDSCPMTEDCPGFDRVARACVVHPDECEFAAGQADAAQTLPVPTDRVPEVPPEARPA